MKNKKSKLAISASFLSCKNIMKSISKLSFTDVDLIHVDFIDGKFVVGKKIPFRKLKKISKFSTKRLDVHLMTNKLKKYIKKFALLNCEYITFHVEVGKNIEKYINLVHSYGIKCGLAINPDTDLEMLEPYLSMIDLVVVMSVVPGYGGQKFIPKTVEKIINLKRLLVENELNVLISVDGGINNETVVEIKDFVDMIVSGSYITNNSNYQEAIDSLR